MLCELCTAIPPTLFTEPEDYYHHMTKALKESAGSGCELCLLIFNSFELQHRRGVVRTLNEVTLPIILSNQPSLREPHERFLELLYRDDVGQTNGDPLNFTLLDDGKCEYFCYISYWL
jgi:hypothetical protein